MKVRFELSKRLAEMAGFPGGDVEVGEGSTVHDALATLTGSFANGSGSGVVKAGSLHPAVLVVVDGEACLPERRDRVLSGGETIDLFLPIAGG